jgi:hypothetical protein
MAKPQTLSQSSFWNGRQNSVDALCFPHLQRLWWGHYSSYFKRPQTAYLNIALLLKNTYYRQKQKWYGLWINKNE